MSLAPLAIVAGLAAGDCHPPTLAIDTSASRVKQGGIVVVVLKSDVPLSRATVSAAGRDAHMEPDAEGRLFRALVGVDFDAAVGKRAIRIEVDGLCGDRHHAHRDLEIVAGRFPIQKLTVAPAYVEPPESERERIRQDREKVALVWQAGEAVRRWQLAFRPPVEAEIRDDFGARRVFNGKPRSPHDGIDIAAPAGAPVTAPAPAVVALADFLYFSGGTLILDHGNSLFTTYFHLSRMDVRSGDRVDTGQKIGEVGSTGRATGPHLHWGARLHGARVNPLDLRQLPDWPLASGLSLTSQSE